MFLLPNPPPTGNMFYATYCVCLLLVLIGTVYTLHFQYKKFFSRWGLAKDLPWINAEDGRFISRARINKRSLFGTRELVEAGYRKYSKNDLPFVLPNITTGPEVILPLSQMDWLLQQPDNVLDQDKVNQRFLQAKHNLLHPRVITDRIHIDVIRDDMSKKLGLVTDEVNDEVDYAIRKAWGVDTKDWKAVCVYETILEIIGRVSLRVLVGFPFCRDEELLKNSMRFCRLVVLKSVILNMFPEFMRPLLSPILDLAFRDTNKFKACAKYLRPIIEARLKEPFAADEKKPFDYIQWSIDHSRANNDPSERTIDLITRRFNVMGFAAIQSSVISASSLLLDLASSPLTPSYFATVRDEINSELATSDGVWSKQVLARMTSLDSGLRESMRLWGFVSRGVLKEVVAKEGVTMPDGLHLPMGVKVGVHSYPIHHDDDIYPNAKTFEPLRFCSPSKDETNSNDDASEKTASGEIRRGIALVTTSSTFMPFSHGKNSCPGRYFASQQLKLILAYIAQNYEIHPIAERPDNQWLAGSLGPPMDFKIHLRRRKETV